MPVFLRSKNEEQNRKHQELIDKYYEGLKQPSLVHLGNVEFIANGEQYPVFNKCDSNCEKCSRNEFQFKNVACVAVRWGTNYSHFILEALAKIIRINSIDPQIPILMYTNRTFRSVLDYFNITNPIHSLGSYTTRNTSYHIENCYQFEDYFDHKTTLEDLNLIRSRVKIADQGDLCVLIRRREADRHLINFEKLYKCLVNNFPEQQWVVFEVQPFHEMIKIFSRAKIIIAPHGAGTCNAIFSPKNVSILELYPQDWIRPAFIHFSHVLGFNHYLYSAERSNFKFDIDEVLQTVLKIVRA